MFKLDYFEQEELTMELICGMETMDIDEWEEKYDILDVEHQIEVDEALQEFADNAVGSSSWRSDW